LDVHEHSVENRLGGLVSIEEHVDVHELEVTPSAAPTASGPPRPEP
jgi:hypothetical protein